MFNDKLEAYPVIINRLLGFHFYNPQVFISAIAAAKLHGAGSRRHFDATYRPV